jgi:hypothetical protein
MSREWTATATGGPNPEKFRQARKDAMSTWGQDFISTLIRENLSGRHGDMGLNRRTGNLAGGWNSALTDGGTWLDLVAWVSGPAADPYEGASHGYAWAEEYGATITPRKAKWLWIPTLENQTPTGQARITPTEAIQRGGFVLNRGGYGMFISKPLASKGRSDPRGYAGWMHGGSKRTGPALFTLAKRVVVKPRMGATSMFRSRFPLLERALAFAGQEAFNG